MARSNKPAITIFFCCAVLLTAPTFAAITFVDSFGSVGSGDGEFSYPSSVAVGSDGDVYVAGSGNRVQRFDSEGNYLSQWGSAGSGDGLFSSSLSIATAADGSVYVCDGGNNRVQRFDATGTFISSWGSYGSGIGQLSGAHGIDVDADGSVYVTEEGNDRVQKFGADGSVPSVFGTTTSGLWQNPYGIAVSASNNIYVAYNSALITEFDSSGNKLDEWGTYGTGVGELAYTRGIGVSSGGLVYVADISNNRVVCFDANGNYKTQFGTAGSGDGEFNCPWDIAVADSGLIYVADSSNNRVQRFFDVDSWVSGNYVLDDNPSTPEVNDAVIDNGSRIGNNFTAAVGVNRGFTGWVTIGSYGTVTIEDGGRLACKGLDNLGAGTFNWNKGTLSLHSDLEIDRATPFRAIGGDEISSGRALEVAGAINITDTGSLTLRQGTVSIGSVAAVPAAGTIAVGDGGTLSLDGSSNSLVGIGVNGVQGVDLSSNPKGTNGSSGGIIDAKTGGRVESTNSAGLSFTGGNGGNGGQGGSIIGMTGKTGGTGGSGGDGVQLTASGGHISLLGAFDSYGGEGGVGGTGGTADYGGDGGTGGSGGTGTQVSINSGYIEIQGETNFYGGDGSDGGLGGDSTGIVGDGYGGRGGSGGVGTEFALSGGTLVLGSTFNATGGNGGNGGLSNLIEIVGDGGGGGLGAQITLDGGELTIEGTLNGTGGDGGFCPTEGDFLNVTCSDTNRGGAGGNGIQLTINSGILTLTGKLIGRGGNGNDGYNYGGAGGDGGTLLLSGGELVLGNSAKINLAGGIGGLGEEGRASNGANGSLRMTGGTLTVDSTILSSRFVGSTFEYETGTFHLTDSGGYTVGANDNLIDRKLGGNHIIRTDGSGLIVEYTLTVPEGKSVYAHGSRIEAERIDNNGTITIIEGELATTTGLNISGNMLLIDSTIEGKVHNPAGCNINVVGDVQFTGLLSGAGGLYGSGTAYLNGGYNPGDSTAAVTVECSTIMGENNTLSIELGGSEAGQFDSLLVLNDMTLGGQLDVKLVSGFELVAGQCFEIIDANDNLSGKFSGLEEGSLVGSFGSVDLLISYLGGDGNDVVLSVVPEPAMITYALLGFVMLMLENRNGKSKRGHI